MRVDKSQLAPGAGTVVTVISGRDKGRRMAVLAFENGLLLLADGRHRAIEQPKKKGIKHVRVTHTQVELSGLTNKSLWRQLANGPLEG